MKKFILTIFLISILTMLAFSSPSNSGTSTVYVSIEYTNVNVHVNIPGQWMFGDLQVITDANHTPIDIQFSTSGDLTCGTNYIPTYYQIYDGNNTSYVPSQPLNASVWQTPNELNGFNITRGIGNHILKIWFAMDISRSTSKGNYTCWIQMSISPHP